MKQTTYNYTKRCPKCGSTHIKQGVQRDYAVIYGKSIFATSRIIYFVCGSCGYIVDQFANKPHNLKEINPE